MILDATRFNRMKKSYLVFFFLFCLLLSAVPAQGSTLRVALSTEPPGIDPHAAYGDSYIISCALLDNLVAFDHDLNHIPGLAESWARIDDLTWRFSLRKGVQFHSGNPWNADAFLLHWERMNSPDDPHTFLSMLSMIEDIVKIDSYTVDIVLKYPDLTFLDILAFPHQAIRDVKEEQRIGTTEYYSTLSGTGPFIMESWKRGEAILLKANPNYWDEGTPRVDYLEFRFIPESTTRILALETGEVDISQDLPAHEAPRIHSLDGFRVETRGDLRPMKYQINTEHPILSDPLVRRALVHSLDVELAVEFILGDGGVAAQGFIPIDLAPAQGLKFEYNPEYAERLLYTAGWERNRQGIWEKDGQLLEFSGGHTPVYDPRFEMAEAFQSLWRDFGVIFEVEAMEHAAFQDRLYDSANVKADSAGVFMRGAGYRSADPTRALWTTYHSEGTWNFGRYNNPLFDELHSIAAASVDEGVRYEAFKAIQYLLYTDVPSIPLYRFNIIEGVGTHVQDYRLHLGGIQHWNLIGLE